MTVTITAAESEETAETTNYDFKQFSNVDITGIDLSSLNEDPKTEQMPELSKKAHRLCLLLL